MNTLKTINFNGEIYELNVQGTEDNLLFPAVQIGNMFGLTNIHSSIATFDEDEKVVKTVYIDSVPQEVTYLTEVGFHSILWFMYDKPITRMLQRWLCQFVTEIRINRENKIIQENEEAIRKLNQEHDENMQKIKERFQSSKDDKTQQQTGASSSASRRVYKYNLTNLSKPIAEFTSLKEAARSVNNQKVHDYHIREACLHCTEFEGFRWFYVDNGEAKPDTIPTTSEIVAKPLKRLGLIAKLSREQDKILEIYQSQKDAAAHVKVKPCAITFSLTNDYVCAGYKWKLYEDCNDALKETFEGEVPEYKQPDTCNKSVERINPQTKEVIEKFSSLQDACSKFATSHKTLKKYSASGDIYKGFIWRLSS